MNTFKLYTDGSHMPNANVSGIGGYLLDENNEQVFEFSDIIDDDRDLTKFEIYAMEQGLKMAHAHGVKNLEVFSDDKSLCDISSLKDPKSLNHYIAINPHLNKVLELLLNFEHITFSYLPREKNKKADTLSRKAILEKIPTAHVPLENSFQAENLLFSEKLGPDDKKLFANYKKKYTDFYFFDMHQEKASPEMGKEYNYFAQAWFCKKTANGLEKTRLKNASLNENLRAQLIDLVSETLNTSNLKTVGLVIYGKNSALVRDLLKGMERISQRTEDALKTFQTTLTRFEEVVFYNDSALINEFYPGSIKDIEKKTPSKEELILAMKILGEQDYEIGNNPQIENYYDLPAFKKDNISEIQKKYFMEFLKIAFRDESLFKAYSQLQAQKASADNAEVLSKIHKIRMGLEDNGIKLRIS